MDYKNQIRIDHGLEPRTLNGSPFKQTLLEQDSSDDSMAMKITVGIAGRLILFVILILGFTVALFRGDLPTAWKNWRNR